MTTREKTLETAVEALAHTLANEALFNADIGGYGWDAEKDSSDHFLPTARKKARRYLEDVLPTALAKAWEEGAEAMCGQDNGGPMAVNPYTTGAQVDGL